MSDPISDTAIARKARKRSRRWFTLTAVAALILAVLVLLPMAVEYGLRNWLLEHGGERVRIGDVDLNPFTGRMQIEGLVVEADGHDTLRADRLGVDLAWRPLLDRHLVIENLWLAGIDMEVRQDAQGGLRIGGIGLPPGGGAGAPEGGAEAGAGREPFAGWGLGIERLTLAEVAVRVAIPKLQMDARIEQLVLSRLASWQPRQGARVLLQASIDGAPLSYEGEVAPFGDAIRIDGDIDLRRLPLAAFREIGAVAGQLDGRLSLQTAVSIDLSGSHLHARFESRNLQLEGLLFATPQIRLQQQTLRWAGGLELERVGVEQGIGIRVSAAGDIDARQLDTRLAAQGLEISQQGLRLAVDFQFDDGIESEGPSFRLGVDKLQVDEVDALANGYPLGGAGRIVVEGLALSESQPLRIDGAQLDLLYLGMSPEAETSAQDGPPLTLFRNHRLRLRRLSLVEGRRLAIDDVLLDGAALHVLRRADGSTNIDDLGVAIASLRAEQPPGAGQGEAGAAASPRGERTRLRIGHLRVSDGGTLLFEDYAVTPMFRADLSIENLEIDKLDSGAPDEVMQVKGKGRFGRFGHYDFRAGLQPFGDKLNANVVAAIKGIDLPRLSPYTARELGFALRSGTLSSDTELRIAQERLDGEARLTLQQLELVPVAERPGSGLDAVSLNASLDMLRDRNNTITLAIPLSGDISAPDFSVQDAINQALMKGVKNGAMTYFMYALQPYGSMLAVAKFAGEQIAKVRLDPVPFLPGDSGLGDTARDYLRKVAKVLQERPKVAVKVCGVAVKADLAAMAPGVETVDDALAKQLRQLARRRSIAVREFIASQGGEGGGQLVGCRPELALDDAEARPRAELLI